MLHQLGERWSAGPVLLHHLQQQVLLDLTEDAVGEVREALQGLLEDEVLGAASEGRVPRLQEVEQPGEAVNVAAAVRRLVVDALRRHVVGRPHVVLEHLPTARAIPRALQVRPREVFGRPEVYQLDPVVAREQHVLRLDVPMDDVEGAVQLLHRPEHLAEEVPDQRVGEEAEGAAPAPQLAALRALHLNVEADFVLEGALDLDGRRPALELLQAVLFHENVCLLLKPLELGLVDLLDGPELAVGAVPSAEDLGEIPPADKLQLVEVFDTALSARRLRLLVGRDVLSTLGGLFRETVLLVLGVVLALAFDVAIVSLFAAAAPCEIGATLTTAIALTVLHIQLLAGGCFAQGFRVLCSFHLNYRSRVKPFQANSLTTHRTDCHHRSLLRIPSRQFLCCWCARPPPSYSSYSLNAFRIRQHIDYPNTHESFSPNIISIMLCAPLNVNLQKLMTAAMAIAFKSRDEAKNMLVSYDFDNIRYYITTGPGQLVFSFACADFNPIWDYCGAYLKEKYYPEFEFKVPGDLHTSVSVVVDEASLEKCSEKGAALISSIAERFGLFKRNFFASPFEMMMHKLADPKAEKSNSKLSFSLRPNEKTWLIYDANQRNMTVCFGISFTDRAEQQIVRTLITEVTEAKKHVNNSPVVKVSESELSEYIVDAFPEEKKAKYSFSNGITSFTFFDKTLSNIPKQATLLAGFRQYLQYHCQASKCNLHSRIISRIEQFYKALVLSKLEQSKLEYSTSA